MKRVLILIFLLYFLALLQASFLPYFTFSQKWWGNGNLNLILFLVILLNLWEKPAEKSGLIAGFFGGFFLDIFSENFFGYWILILIILSLFIKFVLKKYIHPVLRLGA